MPPRGSSLGTALFVVAFLVWCSPPALRRWVWDYIAYVVLGQWIQFVTIYFQPWNWMHNCEFEKWFVFWFTITFTPGVIAHTVITLNGNLPYSTTPAVKGGEPKARAAEPEKQKSSGGCCARVGQFLLNCGSAWGRFWSTCFPNGCCGGRACTDGFLKFWVWAGMVSTAFIGAWAYTVYQQAVCAQGDTCSDTDGPVARGVVSQAQVTWWLDVVALRPLLVLFFVVESWRVRMPLGRTFLLTVMVSLGNGMGACLATPLFLLQYRSTMRSNDLAYWWRRHNGSGKKNDKVADDAAAEPDLGPEARIEPNHDGEVNMEIVTAAVREYMRRPGVSSTTLALELLAHPAPVNSRRFPRLEAFGINLDWEVPAIIVFLLVALHGTYVWLTAVSQQEIAGGICGLMNKQDQQFLRPSAYPMAFTPFWLFLPLMTFELSLGHFFANEHDKKLGQLPSNIATILALLVTYYNNVNVVFVFGVFSAMRLIRLRYGKAIITALTLLQPTAGFSDPMGVAGQQSVWWSSKDPDSYCALEGEDAVASGAVAPAAEASSSSSSSASSSSSKGKGKSKGSKAQVAPDDADSINSDSEASISPAPVRKQAVPCWLRPAVWFRAIVCKVYNVIKTALTGFGRLVCNVFRSFGSLVREALNFLAGLSSGMAFFIGLVEGGAVFAWSVFSNLAWGLHTSLCGGIGGGLCSLYQRWAKFWGWSPLPSPLLPERQGSLGIWMQILLAYQIYLNALCLAINLALWAKDGNSNMMHRWIADHYAVVVAVWLTYKDIEATLPTPTPAAASASAVAAKPVAPTKASGVGSFLLAHPVFAVLLTVMWVIADLLVTPMIDANEPGLNPAFRTLRISLTNLVFNYNQVGLNMPLIGATLLGGFVLTFGTKWPLSRKNGSGLCMFRTALLVLPIVFSLAVVWPEVMQPCPLQLGREFPTVRPSQLLANAAATKGLVTERAFPQDTATSVTRAEALRGAHPKEHGCVKAKLSLPYPIPSKYQHGIFSESLRTSPLPPSAAGVREFDAIVRFSNGQFEQPNGHGGWFLQPDATPDIRGMAVKVVLDANNTRLEKLMAMSPEEVAKADTDRNTQDFVSISSDYFFAKDATHFAGLTAAVSAPNPASAILEWLMPSEFSWRAIKRSASRFVVGMRAITKLTALNMAGGQVLNPRRHDYYSATPYRMGPEQDVTAPNQGDALAVKYRWRPCEEAERSPITSKQMVGLIYVKVAKAINTVLRVVLHLEADSTLQLPIPGSDSVYVRESETAAGQPQSYLRINLQNSLSPFDSQARPACFQLMIQDQLNACQNKIEDAARGWVGEWTPVARLDIPLQLFLQTDALQVCENLSFNPWHALAVHKPLGDINKVRKVAYIESARTRLGLNAQKPVGPVFTGSELPVKTYPSLTAGTPAAVPPISTANVPIAPATPALLYGNPALYAYSDYPYPYERMPKKIASPPSNESFSEFTQSLIAYDQLSTIFAQTIMQPKVEGDEMTKLQEYEFVGLARKGEPLLSENSNHALSGRLRRVPHVDEETWTTDVFWANQFVRGLNPMKVVKVGAKNPLSTRLRKLDAAQKASVAATLRKAGEKATSIEELIAAGRCLFADYPEIEGLMTVESRILYSPVVIFYLTEAKHVLMPLLIQLENVRSCDAQPTVTPAAAGSAAPAVAPCTPYSPPLYFPAPWIPALPVGQNQTSAALQWMFAKMHASQSDGEVHQLISHLLETHLVMEATLIATHRAFSPNHVVYRMLSPHFTGTIAINEFGRMTLVSPVNPFTDVYQSIGAVGANEMMARRYLSEQYIYMETVPSQFARRGFSVPKNYAESVSAWAEAGKIEEVDGFLYKDYALPLFYAMREYVTEVLQTEARFAAAKSAEEKIRAVKADPELYSWFNELFSPAAAGLPLRHRAVPSESWSAFVDFLTQIIFQATAQHASINFPQYDFLSFQPVRPLALQMGMPSAAQIDAGVLTEEYLLHSLVHSGAIQLLQSTYDILSTCCVNTLMLDRSHANVGLLDNANTLKPSFPKLWTKLQDKLEKLEMQEKARNDRREFAYPYLFPSRVPQSIAI